MILKWIFFKQTQFEKIADFTGKYQQFFTVGCDAIPGQEITSPLRGKKQYFLCKNAQALRRKGPQSRPPF
jgi:hypothetical protein